MWRLRGLVGVDVAVREEALVLVVTREVAVAVVILVIARGRQCER
jgi:hypothetical protein